MKNDIKDSKEKILYFLDKLILSAFEQDRNVDTKSIKSECEELTQLIDSEFRTSFEKKKSSINTRPEPTNDGVAYNSLLKGDYATGAKMFAELYRKNPTVENAKHLSNCLLQLGKPEFIKKYFIKELKKHTDDVEILKLVGTTYLGTGDFKEAIPYYEKLITVDANYSLYYQLSFLYERVYQNKKLDKQIEYAQKALELAPKNNLVLAFLAKLHYRAGQKELSRKYFEQMMKNDPTPEEQVLFSRYFLKEGDLKTGYELYKVRFKTSNVAYPKELTDETRWDGKADLSDKTVILHYEQGFGDSVMFVRYLPKLAKLAKKVILVIQKNLIPILKSSGYDKYCEILSHEADVNPNIKLADTNASIMYTSASGMSRIPHDYHIPMMDLPYLFGESPERMEEAGGYLQVDEKKFEDFRKKYIKDNNKIKVGLSYHGTVQSNSTYRDISVKEFLPLFEMEGVEFYSFQADEHADELKNLPKHVKVHNLGRKFKNFEDTACAMKCMDLIISTDNVVMNLGGALGVKTFGLFNVFPESRWYKTDGEDIGWYKSVEPFRAKNYNEWQPVIKEIKTRIKTDFKQK